MGCPVTGPAFSPVSVEKCIAAICHSPSAFETVSERFSGNAKALPSFLPLISPEAISQPMSAGEPAEFELVVEFLLALVEAGEKVLVSILDFLWAGPDLAGTGAHDHRLR